MVDATEARRERAVAGGAPVIVASSATMLDVLAMARRSAEGEAKVLVTGESGVGKDLIARHIHLSSRRAAGPFVAVNCAGLTETLLESELFGHARGSFTGAFRDKPGKLQMADRGTLFLDEVGEMSARMQALLLRFLETGEIQPVGAHHATASVNVRVIAATNRNLSERVAAGEFREDLLYRLRVIHIHVPPLRERAEDIPLLVDFMLQRTGRAIRMSDAALQVLQRHRWPGNVRELQNVVEQAVWLANHAVIEVEHLPENVRSAAATPLPQRERRRQVADDLYDALVTGGYSFWEHIHPIFLDRQITRHDIQGLVSRGLRSTHGNYRSLLQLFGMPQSDYKRFLNFLEAHDCKVDYRMFRQGRPDLPPVATHPAVAVLRAPVAGHAKRAAETPTPIGTPV